MYEEEMVNLTEQDPLVLSSSKSRSSSPGLQDKSVQEVLDDGGFTFTSVLYLVALGIIGIADSMQATYVAIVLPILTCDWFLSPAEQAVVTSLNFCGTGIGAILIGPLSDKFGRKPTAMATSFVLFLSMMVTSAATNVLFFLTFSIISGICCGGSLSIAYTYWAEVSSIKHRPAGVMVITMFWNTGLLGANGFAYFVLNTTGWETYTMMMAVPAAIPVVMLALLPESPKFLNGKNKVDECRKSLRRITSIKAYHIDEITIVNEAGTNPADSEKCSVSESFSRICSSDLRGDTLRILCVYSCLQTIFKAFLFVFAAMLTMNYCDMKNGLTLTSVNATDVDTSAVSEVCEKLTDGDLFNGMMLSTVLYVSTAAGILFCRWFGELNSLRIFSVGCLISLIGIMVCMPVFLMFIVNGSVIFFIAAISLVMYMILPQMYPTVARNSGFGLVDGVGKLVASVAIFVVTALLNYSIRACIGLMVAIAVIINIQVLFTRVSAQLETELDEEGHKIEPIAAHAD